MQKCAINSTLDFISRRWTMQIIHELYKAGSKMRYGELKMKVKGITPKILSQRLKELEYVGIVLKDTDSSSIPIKSYYNLSKRGKDFIAVIKAVKRWSISNADPKAECASTDCRHCRF